MVQHRCGRAGGVSPLSRGERWRWKKGADAPRSPFRNPHWVAKVGLIDRTAARTPRDCSFVTGAAIEAGSSTVAADRQTDGSPSSFPRSRVGMSGCDAPRRGRRSGEEWRSHTPAFVILDKLLSRLAEFYQHVHGWSQLCSHGKGTLLIYS